MKENKSTLINKDLWSIGLKKKTLQVREEKEKEIFIPSKRSQYRDLDTRGLHMREDTNVHGESMEKHLK